MALENSPYFAGTIPSGAAAGRTVPAYGTNLQNPNTMVQDAMGAALDPNSAYIQNARRRGLETAAARGGVNSSIAAGASERAALEAAQPLAQASLGISQAREGVLAEDWMSQQNFSRAMMGQYAQGAFSNTLGMLQRIQDYALEDPELYTPDVVSGYSDFFSQNMNNILSRFFGDRG